MSARVILWTLGMAYGEYLVGSRIEGGYYDFFGREEILGVVIGAAVGLVLGLLFRSFATRKT